MGTFLKLIIAFLLPPLAMFFHTGIGKHFWINLVLSLFGWFPGVIHAFVVIITEDD